MMVKASAASALIVAAGLLVSFAGPSPATAAGRDDATASTSEGATSGKSVRHGSRYGKKRYAYRKYGRVAAKPAETKKAAERDVAEASSNTTVTLPDWVANANAQMMPADATPDSAKVMSEAMSAKASTVLLASADKPADAQAQAETGVVASDQLNDVDRSLQEAAASQTVAMASVKPAAEALALASNNDSSALDKTSLIGKIFIAFGALLTMASAARMFLV